MSAPLHLRDLNRAREYYNPLRGLDIQRLVRLLEQGERGQYADLQKLYRIAERRYYALLAIKQRRLGALKKLDWAVKVPDDDDLPEGVTPAMAQAQADALSAAYYAIENLPQAIEHLALATFRGFAHLEPHHRDDNPGLPVVALKPVPQYHWFRDDQSWEWRYDPTANDDRTQSVPMAEGSFILREVEEPLNEIAVLCFLRANMSKKDWDAFCEDYNIPSVFFALSENTPTDKVKEYLAVAEKVTGNSRGALPPGGTVTTVDESGEGAQFEQHMLWQEREVVMAGTGGLLTMIAESGSGTLAGSAHQEAFDLLAIAEAMEISAILQKQFDVPFLAREFPGQPPVAYFELAAEDSEDLDQLAERLAKLKGAGFEADEGEISEKFGLKLTRTAPVAVAGPGGTPGDPADPAASASPAEGKPPFANRRPSAATLGREARFLGAAAERLAAADRAVLAPLLNRLAALDGADDAGFAAGIEELRRDLPAIERTILVGPASAELETAFEEIVGAALASGFGEATATRKPAQAKNAAKARRQAGAGHDSAKPRQSASEPAKGP